MLAEESLVPVLHNDAEHVNYRTLTGLHEQEQPGFINADSPDVTPSIINVSSNFEENVYSFLKDSIHNSAHAEFLEDETAQGASTVSNTFCR
jgi:predicted alternative tryptophan synthase beta-subunit